MKNTTTEAQLLLNQDVRVSLTSSAYWNCTGRVRSIMADGRTLEVDLDWARWPSPCPRVKTVLLDVTFVSEIRERTQYAQGEPDLGPDANSVLPHNRL